MFDPNVEKVLACISPDDLVLDIGGWARPFNRANFVIDAESYDSRGYYGPGMPSQGGPEEHFRRESWYQRDLCDRTPFPFADKSIDFVICSHVLEDIRDPLWVCAEMIRVGKRGYIEVPSRIAESCRGQEPQQVGWSHHRWLIDIRGAHITFLMKYHTIHSHWRFSLPARFRRALSDASQVQWMFWDGEFSYSERTIHGPESIAAELERFVREVRPYPSWLLAGDLAQRRAFGAGQRVAHGIARRLKARGPLNA